MLPICRGYESHINRNSGVAFKIHFLKRNVFVSVVDNEYGRAFLAFFVLSHEFKCEMPEVTLNEKFKIVLLHSFFWYPMIINASSREFIV